MSIINEAIKSSFPLTQRIPVATTKTSSTRGTTHAAINIHDDAVRYPREPLDQTRQPARSILRRSKGTKDICSHDNDIHLYPLIWNTDAFQTNTVSDAPDPPQSCHRCWVCIYQQASQPLSQVILTEESTIYIKTRSLPYSSSKRAISNSELNVKLISNLGLN